MRLLLTLILIAPGLVLAQNHTSHTNRVSGDTLYVYQHATFFHGGAQYYYIDSTHVTRMAGDLILTLVYKSDTAIASVLSISSREDTLMIAFNPAGHYRLIVNSYQYYDSAFNPLTGQYFDTLWPKDSDTSYFHILTNSGYELEPGFQLYPNPATDFVQINGLEDYRGVTAVVLSQTGQSLISQVLNDNHREITVAGLPSGIYLLKIKIDGKVFFRKLIVE